MAFKPSFPSVLQSALLGFFVILLTLILPLKCRLLNSSSDLHFQALVKILSNSLDPDETPSVSFGFKLFAHGPMVAFGTIMVKVISE